MGTAADVVRFPLGDFDARAARGLFAASDRLARREAALGLDGEPSAAVFLSQPAAEKSAKALLASHNVVFRKTHDLDELGKQCAALAPSLTPLLTETVGLTDYSSNFRYLDAPCEPNEAEATAALGTARRLYEEVRALLALNLLKG